MVSGFFLMPAGQAFCFLLHPIGRCPDTKTHLHSNIQIYQKRQRHHPVLRSHWTLTWEINEWMQRSRKEGIPLSYQLDLLISVIAPTAWLRGSETTDGQLARRWTVYLSREPFAERRPCTGHLRRPPRALGALTRPVHQLRRGCQHGERRRCRLSVLIPARVSAMARGAAAKTMASF